MTATMKRTGTESASRSGRSRFPARSFGSRLHSMLRADARRMFTTSLFPVCLGVSFAIPILVLVMTTMAGSAESGLMFTNTWQILASAGGSGMAAMDSTAMMNSNLMYFLTAVFTCLFLAADFRSGYVKNLFTVRARKGDYVASKTLVCSMAGALFLLAFLAGAVIGGRAAGLSFDPGSAGAGGIVMCMLAKIFLSPVFAAISVLAGVFARQRSWLAVCLALFGGMLLFLMVPMLTPLDSGIGNAGMCLAGGAIFAAGLGAGSNLVLRAEDLAG